MKSDLGTAIIKGALTRETSDLAVDIGQIELDNLLPALKEIPVFKTIVAICQTCESISNQLFFRKVAHFLTSCPKFTEAERANFLQEVNDPKQFKRLSDAVVLYLSRLDDLEKPPMLAKVFAAYVRGKIPYEVFKRLAVAIDMGFIEDLMALPQISTIPSSGTLLRGLLRTGLVEIDDQMDPLAIAQGGRRLWLAYKINDLGHSFIKCMDD